MSEKSVFIPARLKSGVINGHVTGTADIIDDALDKTQDVINQEDKEAIAGLREDVDTINSKIPEEASPENQLADKAFVTTLVDNEKARAEAAETALDNKITAEEQRATSAENTLDAKIDQEISDRIADVDAEENRAKAAEQANATAISNEQSRAESAEQALSEALHQEELRAETAEGNLQSSLNSEIDRATASEQAISSALTAETERAQSSEETLQNNINAENTRAVAAEQTLQNNISAEETRATTAEASLLDAISQEETRARASETTLQNNIDAENTRAEGAETLLQSNITAEENRAKSAENTIAGNLSSEETRAKAAERQNSDDIDTINSKIPSQATSENQLADKDFVNSTVATETAEFKGTYNSLQELEAVTADNNDYGFVITTDTAGNTLYNRYKYNGTQWLFEYSLNNSSFTAAQWATINSDLTSSHKTKLDALPTKSELDNTFDTKQDSISDLETIRSGAASGATAYQKPSTGIPKTDMSSDVQVSLGKADTAIQEHQDISMKADKASTVSSVDYNGTKLTKTINGTSSDVLTVAALKQDLGLDNVANIDQSKAVKAFSVSGNVVTYTCLDNTTGTFQLPISTLENVYIGSGASTSDVMVAGNLHVSLRLGEAISVTSSDAPLWVILPSSFYPTVMMEGIKVPMTSQQDVEVQGVTYKVLKSDNTFTGSFNVVLM